MRCRIVEHCDDIDAIETNQIYTDDRLLHVACRFCLSANVKSQLKLHRESTKATGQPHKSYQYFYCNMIITESHDVRQCKIVGNSLLRAKGREEKK